MTNSNTVNKLLRKAYQDYWRGYREHTQSPDWPRNGQYPPVPDAISGLNCGARTRAGTPCKRIDLYWSGRCKFHGGLSTGPTTENGKAKSRDNGKLGGRGRVLKPNPMETPRNPQGGALIPSPPGGSPDPNPMETVRKRLGLAGISSDIAARFPDHASHVTDGRNLGTVNAVLQPNPMDSSEKPTFCEKDTALLALANSLTKPDFLKTNGGNVSVRVQCKECGCLSVGFKCLCPDSGQLAPTLGEWRVCKFFEPEPTRY